MKHFSFRSWKHFSLLFLPVLLVANCFGQQRPPAVPLIVHDPYFSVWSMNDRLTDGPTRHWTGAEQPMAGIVRIDGKPYRYMGGSPREIPAMEQSSVTVAPTHTVYVFSSAGVRLRVAFFTPAFPQQLDILSRPVTYLTWTAESTDGKEHQVDLLLDVSPRIAVDSESQDVTWGRTKAGDLTVLSVGSRDQQVLNRSGDNVRIDWGYFHLAVPDAEAGTTVEAEDAVREFSRSGALPSSDSMEMPLAPSNGAAHLAVAFHLKCADGHAEKRHVLLAYTQQYAIEYLQRRLKPYWQRNGEGISAMLAQAASDYESLDARGEQYDRDLTEDLTRVGGAGYAQLGALAYRQTFGAHGLVADVDGSPMLFAKENFSNGDIATVDVLYPSAPFFLLFNPALLEGQLRPVLEYAALPRWKFPFAPHDLGRYPLANGQSYGGGEKTEENQMPIEESGNLLILGAALGQAQGDWHVAREFWPQFTKWAEYVRAKGLDPENQLCTDDFAGHLAHNANLSIKAIEGLGAYALMAQGLGHADIARDYMAAAREMAAKWETLDKENDHYRLAFDHDGSWSQKYNLVWDDLLGLHLFNPRVRDTELAFYQGHINVYGLPLDSRADYTKLDWELWTATLAKTPQQFTALFNPIAKWVNETPARVPLTDWYDTKTGKQVGFQARSVVGGIYIKALSDEAFTKKWRGLATPKTEAK